MENNKERIVILSSEIGLVYKFRFELLKKLIQNKDVFLVSPKTQNQDFFLNEIKSLGVHFIEVKFTRRKLNIFQELYILLQYYRILKKINPKKVLTYTIKPNVYGGIMCRVLNIKYVPTITGVGTTFQKNDLIKLIVIFLSRIALKNAEKIFFQNKSNLDIFLKYKITTVQRIELVNGSGVNLNKFRCNIKKLSTPRKIIFIGRIMQEKGINEFLEMVERVKAKYKDTVEFYILGQYEEEKYKPLINNLHRKKIIKYLGVSDDVRNEIKTVHCIINPSWHEGMSNVLLEAGAMKRFLIASNIPGCREIVIENETGFVFEKKNTDDLENNVEKFINLSEEKYIEYIQNSYTHIYNNFNRKDIINKYLNIIM